MHNIFFDSETCGLHSQIVILQYAINDGPTVIHPIWTTKIRDTLNLIEMMVDNNVIGFNMTFDWFHLSKCYTTLRQLNPDSYPIQQIDKVVVAEKLGRDGPCLKPRSCFDLMLYARRGPYQQTMKRAPIRIKKVPSLLVYKVVGELEKRIKIRDIFFARRKNKFRPIWEVYDCFDADDDLDPNFKDIVLTFDASSALKALAVDALGLDTIYFRDISLPKQFNPTEYGYAPYALAVAPNYLIDHDAKGSWPDKIKIHVNHWNNDDKAREYAANDVIYLQKLVDHFHINDSDFNDDDSVLACCVASCRWRGYAIDLDRIKMLKAKAEAKISTVPTYSAKVKEYIEPLITDLERAVITNKFKTFSTKKAVLETIVKESKIDCKNCNGEGIDYSKNPDGMKCSICKGKGEVESEAAKRAKIVLDARMAEKEIQLYNKLLITDRLHADFVVIGTLSSRMSGTGGVNAHGINKEKSIREAFILANPGYELDGGDFQAFEVVLAIAAYGDQKLYDEVTIPIECYKCNGKCVTNKCAKCKGSGILYNKTDDEEYNCPECLGQGNGPEIECFVCKGKSKVKNKIHALFGTFCFPEMTYEEIVESDGTKDDKYTKAKVGLFSQLYGGTEFTLADRLGVSPEQAAIANKRFENDHPGVGRARQRIIDKFCSMRQPNGIGSKVEWHEPAEYVEEPVTGHRRYFTLENMICKALFTLAEKPPKEWAKYKIEVVRRDRKQTGVGAIQSALFASAFALQSANMRAAQNHEIQSAGAKILKYTQRRVWDIQPQGIHEFLLQIMNIHDELLVPRKPGIENLIKQKVYDCIEYFKSGPIKNHVPLLAIDWKQGMSSWGAKSG